MTNYGQPDFHISIGSSSGATALKDISGYVDAINSVDIEALVQQSDAFGDAWVESLYVGVKKGSDLTLQGFYDDVAASGPHALLGDATCIGGDRLVELNFGASDILAFRGIIMKYNRSPSRGQLTRYAATIRPTGAMTTAT